MESKRTRLDTKVYIDKRSYTTKKQKQDQGVVKQILNNSKKNRKSPGKPKISTIIKPKVIHVENTVIIDTGASTIKVGNSNNEIPRILPNCIMKAKSEKKRFFIGDQIEECRDLSGLYYIMTHEKGYLSRYDIQKTVWDYTFSKAWDDTSVIMTQPINNFRPIQEYMDEIFFEEYAVKSLYRTNASDLTYYNYVHSSKGGNHIPCLVVDSGYSFSHVIPYLNGEKYSPAIGRINIGGKLLTNYLKDILSYRQLHVMEETYVINQVKEDTCFMSSNFKKDMEKAQYTDDIVKNYVLPDFHTVRRGYVHQSGIGLDSLDNCQILKLNNERIIVPEILMQPSIIPLLNEAGLSQSIATCILNCPEHLRRDLATNIILVGGNCNIPGFKARIEHETRMHLPSDFDVNIFLPADPITYSWHGGKSLSYDPHLRTLMVTKQEYEEIGHRGVYDKFNKFQKCLSEPVKKSEVKPKFSYFSHLNNVEDLFGKDKEEDEEDEEEKKDEEEARKKQEEEEEEKRKEAERLKQKPGRLEIAANSDIQFLMEGDDIEKFDGQYVTLEFDFTPEATRKLQSIRRQYTSNAKAKSDIRTYRRKRIPQPQPEVPIANNKVLPDPTVSKEVTVKTNIILNNNVRPQTIAAVNVANSTIKNNEAVNQIVKNVCINNLRKRHMTVQYVDGTNKIFVPHISSLALPHKTSVVVLDHIVVSPNKTVRNIVNNKAIMNNLNDILLQQDKSTKKIITTKSSGNNEIILNTTNANTSLKNEVMVAAENIIINSTMNDIKIPCLSTNPTIIYTQNNAQTSYFKLPRLIPISRQKKVGLDETFVDKTDNGVKPVKQYVI